MVMAPPQAGLTVDLRKGEDQWVRSSRGLPRRGGDRFFRKQLGAGLPIEAFILSSSETRQYLLSQQRPSHDIPSALGLGTSQGHTDPDSFCGHLLTPQAGESPSPLQTAGLFCLSLLPDRGTLCRGKGGSVLWRSND